MSCSRPQDRIRRTAAAHDWPFAVSARGLRSPAGRAAVLAAASAARPQAPARCRAGRSANRCSPAAVADTRATSASRGGYCAAVGACMCACVCACVGACMRSNKADLTAILRQLSNRRRRRQSLPRVACVRSTIMGRRPYEPCNHQPQRPPGGSGGTPGRCGASGRGAVIDRDSSSSRRRVARVVQREGPAEGPAASPGASGCLSEPSSSCSNTFTHSGGEELRRLPSLPPLPRRATPRRLLSRVLVVSLAAENAAAAAAVAAGEATGTPWPMGT